jgi:hypothetical protein
LQELHYPVISDPVQLYTLHLHCEVTVCHKNDKGKNKQAKDDEYYLHGGVLVAEDKQLLQTQSGGFEIVIIQPHNAALCIN